MTRQRQLFYRGRTGTFTRVFGALCLALATPVIAQAPDLSKDPPTDPGPNAPTSMMVVFDASGSMWGRIENDRPAKFIVAREALRTALGKARPDTRVGLTLFGHRRPGDCTDVQVALPLEPSAVERHVAPLEKLNPKGRGPIATALRDAAKALGAAPAPRTLILVHDDQDNCQGDPCAALADMQATAPGLVIHVVGLAVKDDPQRLMCLTQPTNGRLFAPQNENQVQQSIDDAVAAATNLRASGKVPALQPGPGLNKVSPPVATPAPVSSDTRRPLAVEGPSAVRLTARLARDRAPEARNIVWTITSTTPQPVVRRALGQDVSLALPDGRYEIQARDSLVTGTTTVTVGPKGETAADLVLEGGTLAFKFPEGVEPAREKLAATAITVMELDVASGLLKPVGMFNGLEFSDASALPAVPPGNYLVRLERNGLRVDRPVLIAAGAATELDGTLGAGLVTVNIRSPFDDGEQQLAAILPGLLIQVFEDDPEAPRGRREVARAAGATAEFDLPAGTYTVVARRGSAETRERIALAAGATRKTEIALQSARLTLTSVLKARQSNPIPSEEAVDAVAFRLERLDVVPPEVTSASRQTPTFELTPGRYRVETLHGNSNARSAFEVTLAVGTHERLAVEQPAGIAALTFGTNAPPIDLTWEVRNLEGASIYASAQPTPRIVLLAGTYILRAETRGRRFERQITIAAGESQNIAFGD